ncbi:glycosyltransferase family 2 protein [Erysipelatoclostridium sp. An173]|uniref:glycosyltransferase family 2 protein n=1 Tax=Erysipelatoclostridium sp. An173 TaxID=1965571 RepID=UPI00320AAAE5
MQKKIIMIIPAYNEEECILNTYNKIERYNQENNTKYDVIVINDCSTDGTLKICMDNNIPVISLVHNLGIGGAVQTGYKYALENNYDIALQYDGDGQHDINYVSKIIKPIIEDQADFVIGSRFVEDNVSEFKSSFARRIGIKLISFTIKVVTRKKIKDVTSGFRAANKLVIADFAKSYPIDYPEPITNTELLKKNYRVKEIGVSMNEREGGKSSIHSWKNAYYMINVILSVLVVGIRRFKRVR